MLTMPTKTVTLKLSLEEHAELKALKRERESWERFVIRVAGVGADD